MNPNPLQMVRIGLGDEALSIPLYRFVYVNDQDSTTTPGGFFTSSNGEFGVAVDARLSPEEVQQVMAAELQKNAPVIAAILASRTKKKEPAAAAPSH